MDFCRYLPDLSHPLTLVPLYPFCLLLGGVLLVLEPRLAGSNVVQLGVTLMSGVVLAAAVLVMVVYR